MLEAGLDRPDNPERHVQDGLVDKVDKDGVPPEEGEERAVLPKNNSRGSAPNQGRRGR